jgi:hypothetical protein
LDSLFCFNHARKKFEKTEKRSKRRYLGGVKDGWPPEGGGGGQQVAIIAKCEERFIAKSKRKKSFFDFAIKPS